MRIVNPWLWLDLETTGLDPKTDEILSLGFILTDSNLVEVCRSEFTVGLTSAIDAAFKRAPQVVKDMHEKSGLYKRVLLSTTTLAEGMAGLHRVLDLHLGDSNPPTLAGSTVHFDRSFIYEHAPALLRRLGHRHLDVSTLKVLANAWGVEPFPKAAEKAHTPLADLEHSLAEFRHWRSHMLNPFTIPNAILNADYAPSASEG